MFVSNILGQLEKRTLLDTMAKEVVGINAPKILFTRSKDERIDAATSEIGNTFGLIAVGGILNWGLKHLFKGVQAMGGRAEQWAILGRTGALYSSIFALMWAMPFVRNYVTALRTGKTSFTDVINSGAYGAQKEDVRTAMAHDKRKVWQVLGLGGLATALFTGLGLLAAKKQAGLGLLKGLFSNNWIREKLLLKNGSFDDFSGLKAVLFWGLPAYGGWYDASRDPYEKKEQLLKFASFVAGFSGPQLLLGRYFKKTFEKLLPAGVEAKYLSITQALAKETSPLVKANLEKALGTWKKKSLYSLLLSIGLLSATQLLNFHLTGKRMARAKALEARKRVPLPAGDLRHKTFAEWGQRTATAYPWAGQLVFTAPPH